MRNQILTTVLTLAVIGGGTLARGDDDTAQVLGSIFSGISGVINAANSAHGGYGYPGGSHPGYGNYGSNHGNYAHPGGNWNGYSWGGYSEPTYPQNYASNYPPYGYTAATRQPTYQPVPQPVSYGANAATSTPAVTPARIKIVNPASNGTGLKFHLNGRLAEISAGREQELDREYVIEFSRGTGFGVAKYQLTSGIYTFQPSDQGWELFRRPWQY